MTSFPIGWNHRLAIFIEKTQKAGNVELSARLLALLSPKKNVFLVMSKNILWVSREFVCFNMDIDMCVYIYIMYMHMEMQVHVHISVYIHTDIWRYIKCDHKIDSSHRLFLLWRCIFLLLLLKNQKLMHIAKTKSSWKHRAGWVTRNTGSIYIPNDKLDLSSRKH